MGLEFDDEAAPAPASPPAPPPPRALAVVPAPAAGDDELEPGQLAYESLADVVAELEPRVLMAVVAAVQRNDDWQALPPAVRAIFQQLEGEMFDVDEGEAA